MGKMPSSSWVIRKITLNDDVKTRGCRYHTNDGIFGSRKPDHLPLRSILPTARCHGIMDSSPMEGKGWPGNRAASRNPNPGDGLGKEPGLHTSSCRLLSRDGIILSGHCEIRIFHRNNLVSTEETIRIRQ